MRGRGRGAEPGRRGAEGRGAGRVGGRARWEGGEPRGGGFPSPQPGRRRGAVGGVCVPPQEDTCAPALPGRTEL